MLPTLSAILTFSEIKDFFEPRLADFRFTQGVEQRLSGIFLRKIPKFHLVKLQIIAYAIYHNASFGSQEKGRTNF